MIETKAAFWRPGFFQPIKAFRNTFQIALIGWIKAGPPKNPLLFDHVNRLRRLHAHFIY